MSVSTLKSEIAAINDDHIIRAISDEDILPPDAGEAPPEELYEQLVEAIKKYHPSDDMTPIREAYELSADAHKNQLRRSGAPYIIHPLHVAIILAELEMDKESIIAGLLHDVVEDTDYTLEDIEKRFGPDVALLVDGVTKLTRLTLGTTDKLEMQAENLRKMFLSMSKDIRIIIIKLADRLHNMRTLQFQKPEKQREKARETLDIYAPLASRLGIFRLKMELDNLSLQYLEPEKYAKLVHDIDERSHSREEFVQSIVGDVSKHLTEAGINAKVYGRVKHYFSIYKKMAIQQKSLDEIYDLFAVRILVDTVQDCYAVLGLIHEMYMPLPGRFKDYIAIPKANMYQSLHTTVIGKSGVPFEIQIRTYEMHRTAEYGVAAHWKYKEGGNITKEEEKLNWLRQILEWQRDMPDNSEFMESIRNDLDIFADTVYCFTPQGDVKNLPAGSTPIDFAYSIHSAVGNKMVGARVNEKLVPIDYILHNGDRVEIITSQNSRGPSRDWLNMVKSSQARNRINQWFKEQNKDENIIKGKDLLERSAKAKGYNLPDLTKPEFMEKVMKKYGFQEWNAVLASIGHGGLKEGQVINKLAEERRKEEQRHITDAQVIELVQEFGKKTVAHSKGGIVVEGLEDLAVHFSRCCSPIPGDEIVGFVTRGRGVSIHRTDCVNVMNLPAEERDRLLDAEWQLPENASRERYLASLVIHVNNRVGMLADISRVLTEMNIDIISLNTKVNKQGIATVEIQFQTTGTDEIRGVTTKLQQIVGVFDVTRT